MCSGDVDLSGSDGSDGVVDTRLSGGMIKCFRRAPGDGGLYEGFSSSLDSSSESVSSSDESVSYELSSSSESKSGVLLGDFDGVVLGDFEGVMLGDFDGVLLGGLLGGVLLSRSFTGVGSSLTSCLAFASGFLRIDCVGIVFSTLNGTLISRDCRRVVTSFFGSSFFTTGSSFFTSDVFLAQAGFAGGVVVVVDVDDAAGASLSHDGFAIGLAFPFSGICIGNGIKMSFNNSLCIKQNNDVTKNDGDENSFATCKHIDANMWGKYRRRFTINFFITILFLDFFLSFSFSCLFSVLGL